MFPYIGRIDFLAPDAHLLTTQTGPDVSQIWHLLSDIEMRKHFSVLICWFQSLEDRILPKLYIWNCTKNSMVCGRKPAHIANRSQCMEEKSEKECQTGGAK